MTNNKPIHKIKLGNIVADIWENTATKNNNTIKFYSISIGKNIVNTKKEWQTVHSYNKNDLHKLITVTQKAFEWVSENNPNKEEETD